MELQELKEKCLAAIDRNKEQIIELGQAIYQTPELGYKEFQTQKKAEEAFANAGFTVEKNLAYTGCRASSGKKDGPTVGVLGELDCILCADHPDSQAGGNVHACGHNVQIANLFGCALGLKESGALEELGGNVEFLAVPAEEGACPAGETGWDRFVSPVPHDGDAGRKTLHRGHRLQRLYDEDRALHRQGGPCGICA